MTTSIQVTKTKRVVFKHRWQIKELVKHSLYDLVNEHVVQNGLEYKLDSADIERIAQSFKVELSVNCPGHVDADWVIIDCSFDVSCDDEDDDDDDDDE